MRRLLATLGLVGVTLVPSATAAHAVVSGMPQWTMSVNGSNLPAALLGDAASTTFDAATGQVVLAGGTTGTWTWDGRIWVHTHPAHSPIPRYRPVLGYDDATRQVVMFGGDIVPGTPGSPPDSFDDTWTWNGDDWSQQHPAHHPASGGACAGFDQATGQFLMLGWSQDTHLATWTWSGADWTELSVVSTENSFSGCSMVYDPDLHTEVLLGHTGLAMQALLTWDCQTWNVLQSSLPWPTSWGFTHDALTYDADTGQIIALVDAYLSVAPYSEREGWAMSGTSWARIDGAIPAGHGHLTADPATHQIVSVMQSPGDVVPETWVYAAPGTSSAVPTRVSGPNREQTAIAISESSFPTPGSASAVVLARADGFADAIAGGPLAAKKNAPLLLTPPGSLDPSTRDEILRVLPAGGTVYLLGGPAAVSQPVASQIEALGDVPVRVAGADRFATAVAIAHEMGDPTTVFEVSGADFPDGLSAAPAAIATKGAVLLTDATKQAPATSAYLVAHPGIRYAVGGAAAAADPSATAIVGGDRYATAADVALAFFPDASGVTIASGLGYSDALASGGSSGLAGAPVLLVPSAGQVSEPVTAYIATHAVDLVTCAVVGGAVAVSDAVVSAVGQALVAQ